MLGTTVIDVTQSVVSEIHMKVSGERSIFSVERLKVVVIFFPRLAGEAKRWGRRDAANSKQAQFIWSRGNRRNWGELRLLSLATFEWVKINKIYSPGCCQNIGYPCLNEAILLNNWNELFKILRPINENCVFGWFTKPRSFRIQEKFNQAIWVYHLFSKFILNKKLFT